MSVIDPASLVDWRAETAPSADGPWALARTPNDDARWAFIPPGVTVFVADAEHAWTWRATHWPADRQVDLRGEPPSHLQPLELRDVLAVIGPGLRRWARSEHRHAVQQRHGAVRRARAASRAHDAESAQAQLDELERQAAEASLSARRAAARWR